MPFKKVSQQNKRNFSKQNNNHLEKLETPTETYLVETRHRLKLEEAKRKVFEEEPENEEVTMDFDNSEAQKMNEALQILFAKNKISSKNAFEVPVIDVRTLRSISQQGEGSWNKVSNTLGNSTKVYGFRVDCMVDNAAKMSASFLRIEQTESLSENTEKIQEQLINSILKHKDSQPDYFKFLEPDPQKISQNQLERRDNPLLLEIRRKFDQNGVSGLLLNELALEEELYLSLYPEVHQEKSLIFIQAQNQEFSYPLPFLQRSRPIPILRQIQYIRKCLLDPNPFNMILQNLDNTFDLPDFDSMGFSDGNFFQNLEVERMRNESPMLDVQENDDAEYVFQKSEIIQKRSLMKERGSKTLKNIQKNKGKNKVNENKPKKQRKKRTNTVFEVDFQSHEFSNRSEVLTVDFADLLRKDRLRSSFVDKNLVSPLFADSTLEETRIFSQFSILINPYIPIPDNNNNYHEQISNNESFMHHRMNNSAFTQITTIQNKAANIKITKQRYLTMIEQKENDQVKFSELFQQYSKEYTSSQQICFLAILHLCNQHNYQIEGDPSLNDFTLMKRF